MADPVITRKVTHNEIVPATIAPQVPTNTRNTLLPKLPTKDKSLKTNLPADVFGRRVLALPVQTGTVRP